MTTFGTHDFNLNFNLNRPGALIAALPAVLGFIPEKSLVLVTVHGGDLGCVMRVDLSDDLYESLDHMADVAASSVPDGAIAVIVDEDGAACRLCAEEHRHLANALAKVLAQRDITLLAAHVVDELAAGGRWRCADGCHNEGIIEDPMSSPMAVAAVVDGRRLYAHRSELQDVIAIDDPERTAALRAAMQCVESDAARPDADARADVEHALNMATALAGGQPARHDDLVRIGCSLIDPRVRDTMYALAVGRDADQAEALWALLARSLPDPWRVEALVLLAFSAYARGDGPLAGIALEAAQCSDANHRMAGMLDTALQSGMRPDQIRELAQTGYRLAKRLGVRLPPRQESGRRAG